MHGIYKRKGVRIYNESRTFTKQAHAKTWGIKRVLELEQNGAPDPNSRQNLTLGELIFKYINDKNLGGIAGRTKRYVLNMLLDSDIATLSLDELSTNHIIDHCRHRKATGASPSTINHDISYLASVLKSAKPIYGIDYTLNPAYEARPLLLQMGLIGKSKRRNRRLVEDELNKLKVGLQKRSEQRESKIPFVDILDFSILTCMRIGEVCKILWADVDEENRSVVVRDRKDPRKKSGNHMIVPLLGEAWDILQNNQEQLNASFHITLVQ